MSHHNSPISVDRLLDLMTILRDPDRGCAWDIAQTSPSIAPYVIEEAYEVAEAIASGNQEDLCEELGDLLLQVVFHAQIAKEQGQFDFHDVIHAITTKLIRRHPHVFDSNGDPLSDTDRIDSLAEISTIWERAKQKERQKRSPATSRAEPLGSIALSLPALTRAEKLSKKAATFRFDWTATSQVIDKVREEIAEVEQAISAGQRNLLSEEIGDLLFSVANLARHLDIDPEEALRNGNRKFERRFTAMAEIVTAQGGSLDRSDLDTMEDAWQQVKQAERKVE